VRTSWGLAAETCQVAASCAQAPAPVGPCGTGWPAPAARASGPGSCCLAVRGSSPRPCWPARQRAAQHSWRRGEHLRLPAPGAPAGVFRFPNSQSIAAACAWSSAALHCWCGAAPGQVGSRRSLAVRTLRAPVRRCAAGTRGLLDSSQWAAGTNFDRDVLIQQEKLSWTGTVQLSSVGPRSGSVGSVLWV